MHRHRRIPTAAAGALVAALVVGGGVSAATGDNFVLGVSNSADNSTTLTGAIANPTLRVLNTSSAAAVRGEAQAGAGLNGSATSGTGVQGSSQSGPGLLGHHTNATGVSPGVQGQTSSTDAGAAGVLGRVLPTGASGAGVLGTHAGSGVGVLGRSAGPGGTGVRGEGSGSGGYFQSASTGVVGCGASSAACDASLGNRSVGGKFNGRGANGLGIYACGGNDCSAVPGGATPIGALITAGGSPALGLWVQVHSGAGIQAEAAADGSTAGLFFGDGTGVWGNSSGDGGFGLIGNADGDNGTGVAGIAEYGPDAVGVLGRSSTGLAGKFEGPVEVTEDVHVTGRITKSYAGGTSNLAIPIAYGAVASNGSLLSGTPNVSVTYSTATVPRYEITIAGETYNDSTHVATVTRLAGGGANVGVTTTAAGAGKLLVFNRDPAGTPGPGSFHFVVYKP
jgi:hypothetical protein